MITFGKVNDIETEGFKWNLSEKEFFKTIEWANFLSTSNEFISDKIKVSSSDPLFIVAAMKP
jgi:thiamine pyrophosphokinase